MSEYPAATMQIIMTLTVIFSNLIPLGFAYLIYRFFTRSRRRSARPGIFPTIFGKTPLTGLHRVVDGDSIEILHECSAIERVRLEGLDAPEYHTQPYGREARAALEHFLCASDAQGRAPQLRIQRLGYDRYGRTLARIWREDTSAATWMIGQGHAWAADSFAGSIAMAQARAARRGLWADRSPIRPDLWRRVST